MDISLGVSMTPTTVRMVLVEGEKANGVIVDHDVFDVVSDGISATAPERVLAAILGTRESAEEGGHQLVSTVVAWRDHDDAAALRDALAARRIDDVMLVSELHAAGALAEAAGAAMSYQRTALLLVDADTATLSVVETADGSIVRVQRLDTGNDGALAELTSAVAGLERLGAPPECVFVVGSGESVAAIRRHVEAATSLPVSAPDEPELALARGAALAGARAPLFEAATVSRAYGVGGDGPTVASDFPLAGSSSNALAYSEVDPDDEQLFADAAPPVPVIAAAGRPARKPFLVGSAMTGIFVVGVGALVVSLAVSIRPTVDQRPAPGESVIVPPQSPIPAAAVPAPLSPLPETIPAPVPVVQEAPRPQAPPRTVYVEAPAPAPAAPATVPVGAVPAAPVPAPAAPVPAPVIPVPDAPPVVAPVAPVPAVVPRMPVIRWPWDQNPQQQAPRQQAPQPVPQQPVPQQVPQQVPQHQAPEWNPPKQKWPGWDPPKQKWPDWDPPQSKWPQQSGSGRGSGGSGDDGPGSHRGGNSPLWPWPSGGH